MDVSVKFSDKLMHLFIWSIILFLFDDLIVCVSAPADFNSHQTLRLQLCLNLIIEEFQTTNLLFLHIDSL